MIILEKSELPFSKCPTKNYITPPPEKNVNPLKRGTSITTPPPPPSIYIPITTLRMFFFPSNFLCLKKLTMCSCVLVKSEHT